MSELYGTWDLTALTPGGSIGAAFTLSETGGTVSLMGKEIELENLTLENEQMCGELTLASPMGNLKLNLCAAVDDETGALTGYLLTQMGSFPFTGQRAK